MGKGSHTLLTLHPKGGGGTCLVIFFFFFFFVFLGPHPRHMEVPRLGVELELQLPANTTATATQYLSHICNPTPKLTATMDP